MAVVADSKTLKGFRSLAATLGRSIKALKLDYAAGALPAGYRLGRTRYWLASEIEQWLLSGAPRREEWESLKQRRQVSPTAEQVGVAI